MCALPCREPPLEKSDDTLALEEQRDTDSDGVLTNDDSSLPDLELEPQPDEQLGAGRGDEALFEPVD